MEQEGLVDRFDIDKSSPTTYFCEACIQAKQTVSPYPKESGTIYKEVGSLVVMDVWGPAQIQSLQGSKYFVSFTHMYLHFTVVDFIKCTSEVL